MKETHEPTKRPGAKPGPHIDPEDRKIDLATCPVQELARRLKKGSLQIDEIPFNRRAQVKAFKKKEKKPPNLAQEKVLTLEKLVKDREKQVGEIPLQKRIQMLRKMELEAQHRKYLEEHPD